MGGDLTVEAREVRGTGVFEESNREAENCLGWRERLNLFVNTGGVPQLHLRAIAPVLGGRAGGDGAQGDWLLQLGPLAERERRRRKQPVFEGLSLGLA